MLASKLIQYWRDSLADSARSELDADRFQSADKVTPEEAAAGAIKPERIAVLFKNAEANKKQAKPHSSTAEPLSVLLCLRLLRRKVRRSEHRGKDLGLIWLPAELTPAGTLQPSPNLPWIPRDLLEPIYEAELTLGDVEALDAYLTEHPKPVNRENSESPPCWSDAWAYAEAMFQRVAGVSLQAFQVEGYQKSESVYLLREQDEQKIPPRHILKLYDHLLRQKEVPPLLERYMLLDPPPPRPFLTTTEEITVSAKHVGQMSAEYPLLPSQRSALYHLLAQTDSGILAVSGPPGTGKTTLLQSVIASLWVEAAITGGEPPVIVATSSNNQAISNVIARLGEAVEDDTALRGRWLPDVSSYGLSCQSAGKEEANTQTSDRINGGFMLGTGENAETQSYANTAESHFLAACARWAGRSFADVASATATLHSALTEVTDAIAQGPLVWLAHEDARRIVAERYEGHAEEAIKSLNEELTSLEQEQIDLEKERLAWLEFDSSLFWLKLFAFLPPVKQQQVNRTELYFAKRDLEVRADISHADGVKAFFTSRKDALRGQKGTTQDALARARTDLSRLEHAAAAWSAWCNANRIQSESSRFLEETDTRLRYTAFKLATHYWEGRWLLDMKGWLARHPSGKDFQGEADQAARWRRYAKLAPCVISTFYMLPAYFDVYNRTEGSGVPFYNFIDLLIVDEAGQVAPDVAGASFALAKCAFVIGDTKQLEPVQKLSRGVDRGNISAQDLGQHGLTLEALSALGLAASDGNVMRVAENANRYQEGTEPRNLLLAEHLRCVPEIMAYFNALAYEKQLVAMRKPLEGYPLPHFGYAHIAAESVKDPRSKSRTNPTEAEVIVDWLVDQRPILEAYYQQPLEEIVAVVTPFRQQANLIERRLKSKKIIGLKVGTVHVLQGGERPVVLFSSVYGAKDRTSYFFDKGVNMLNVATSRARDSFLVFGNMAVFHLPSTKPSGLLGTYLFADPGNELTNLRLPVRAGLRRGTVHLDTLEARRDTLGRALREATRSVYITSPFLAENAVLADAVPTLVANAVQRKVTVTIYTDPQLNQRREGGFKASFLAAQRLLEASGAAVALVRAEHSKTLIVDDAVLVEGSFNWLSASRDPRSAFQRRERSLRYEGGEVGDIIQNILTETQKRILT